MTSTRTIHKYVLPFPHNEVSTFERARFLHAAEQHEQITVWAEVNTLERECRRTVHVVGTGGEVPPNVDYVGTAVCAGGEYVFHIYADREVLQPYGHPSAAHIPVQHRDRKPPWCDVCGRTSDGELIGTPR